LQALLERVREESPDELTHTLSVAYPDQMLTKLLEQRAEMERQLSQEMANKSDNHPDVKKINKGFEQLNQQIQGRISGILRGIEIKADSLRSKAEQMDADLENLVERDIESMQKFRPYFRAKRRLENIQKVYDDLSVRLMEQKIYQGLPARLSED
jgi:uncharacterized protein involved in exopolysaccharide biosynthesis